MDCFDFVPDVIRDFNYSDLNLNRFGRTKQLVKALAHDFFQTLFIILFIISIGVCLIYDYVFELFQNAHISSAHPKGQSICIFTSVLYLDVQIWVPILELTLRSHQDLATASCPNLWRRKLMTPGFCVLCFTRSALCFFVLIAKQF